MAYLINTSTFIICVLSGARAVTAQSIMRRKIINLATSRREARVPFQAIQCEKCGGQNGADFFGFPLLL